MKLSDLTTGQAADVMVQITPLIAKIAGDEKAVKAIGNVANIEPDTMLTRDGFRTLRVNRYASFVTVLLEDHRADVFGILAALNQRSVDAIEKQKFTETLRHIREDVVEDEDLWGFLASFMPSVKTGQSAPSSSAPNTSAQEESSPPSRP